MDYFERNMRLLQRNLQLYAQVADRDDLQRWLNLATELGISIETRINTTELSRQEKQKCLTWITHVTRIKNQLQDILSRTGGDLQQQPSTSTTTTTRTTKQPRVCWNDLPSAFQKRIQSGVITNLGHVDIVSFLNDAFNIFKEKIAEALQKFESIKVHAELSAEFVVENNDAETIGVKYFNTASEAINQTSDLKTWYEEFVMNPIQQQLEEFEERGSGWSLLQILSIIININQYIPIQGSSYIPIPPFIRKKNACINVDNSKLNGDEQCFKWAILSALHPVDTKNHPYRVNHYYAFQHELNFEKMTFPVTLKQIPIFKKQNSISINVFIFKKYGQIYRVASVYLTSAYQSKHINLLLVQDHYIDENVENEDKLSDEEIPIAKFHYVWIKNLSRLISSQMTKHNGKSHICDRCLHFFQTEEKLRKHLVDCLNINKCKINLPSADNKILKFKNYKNKEMVPFVIYADFECVLKPIEDDIRAFQQHQPFSIGYYLECSYDETKSTYKNYRQEDITSISPAEWFVLELKNIAQMLEDFFVRKTSFVSGST